MRAGAASPWRTVRRFPAADPGSRGKRTGQAALAAVALILCLGAGGAAHADAPPRFPAAATWHQDIRQAPLHPNSATMISTLAGLGGFGFGRMQIDVSVLIVNAAQGAPTRSIVG